MGVAITVTVGPAARVTAMRAGLLRVDQYDAPPETLVCLTDMGSASPLLPGITEVWITRDTLIEDALIPAHTQHQFPCKWQLPADAGTAREGAIVPRWLVAVDIERPRGLDVHLVAEVRLATAPS